jgi:1-aminocyclopropane-1-carboxylate synthase
VTFGATDPFSFEAVAIYERTFIDALAAGKSIKALLICNPYNPLSQRYPPATLTGFLALVVKYSIHLVSDEIYALSTFPILGRQVENFTSVLSPTTMRPDLVHVFYGMPKVRHV